MSTSMLYHTNSISGVNYKTTRYESGCIIWEVEVRHQIYRCPHCAPHLHNLKDKKMRRIRTVPIGLKHWFLEMITHRLESAKCAGTNGGQNFHLWQDLEE